MQRSINWKCPEFDYYPKDSGWSFLVIVAGLVVIAIAVWLKNFLFAVFSALAVVMVLVWGWRKPRLITCRLSEDKLELGKVSYQLNQFEGFDIKDEQLILKQKGRLGRFIKTKINKEQAGKIKEVLKKNLPEVEYEESLIDVISRWAGF